MSEVRIVPVDERDSCWEDDHPRFRVYLHGFQEEHQRPGSRVGGTTATYDVTGADVLQVIDWAQRQAGDTLTYAVALVYDDPARGHSGEDRGLVWLVGMDGMSTPLDAHEADASRRMLTRREKPVVIPVADRMPPGVPDPYTDGTEQRSCRECAVPPS